MRLTVAKVQRPIAPDAYRRQDLAACREGGPYVLQACLRLSRLQHRRRRMTCRRVRNMRRRCGVDRPVRAA